MKKILTSLRANYHSVRFALIPVLGCVLVVVVFRPQTKLSASHKALALNSTAASHRPAASAKESAEYHWPTVDIEEIVAFDPFRPFDSRESQIPSDKLSPNSGKEPQVQQAASGNAKALASWGKLQAIISDESGAAAILDSRVIHVGDELPGGGRVVAINARGIVVENE
jgi:hypothetical protein